MTEPGERMLGLLAEFRSPEAVLDAAKAAYRAGYRRLDAFTPFPVDGLAEAIGFRETRVAWFTFAGGLAGAAAGYGMQLYTNYAYPIDIGGRPLFAPPAFMLITFELMVLGAVLACIGSMFILNRLPRLSHPLFDVPDFHLASADRFFLVLFADDALFERNASGRFLAGLDPHRIVPVHDGEPAP